MSSTSTTTRPAWLHAAAERAARCPHQHQLGDRVVGTGRLLIGSGHQRALPRHADPISGPHRAPPTLGDRAVMWACGIAALFVAGLLLSEWLA